MIYAGNSVQAVAYASIAPVGRRTLGALFLQFREQFGEQAEDSQFGGSANGVLSARRWQNKYQRAVQALLLKSQFARPLRKVLVGGFAVEGDHLGRILLELLCQQNAALCELLAAQFI